MTDDVLRDAVVSALARRRALMEGTPSDIGQVFSQTQALKDAGCVPFVVWLTKDQIAELESVHA